MLIVLKTFVLTLKTILNFASIRSIVIEMHHKDTIWNEVYDSRMVFYNGLFLDDKLFTLHSSVFAIFCSYRKN